MKPEIVNESWYKHLQYLFDGEELEDVRKSFKYKFCPDAGSIFKAFSSFDFSDTRVVFLGLSPYQTQHKGINRATGVAFGVPGEDYDTPSLEMIRECLFRDTNRIDIEEHFDYTLEDWCKQGCLMLNSALTVDLNGEPRGHLDKWKFFVEGVLKELNALTGIIFVFLGNDAKKFSPLIDRNRHHVIETVHPVATYYKLIENAYDWSKIPEVYDFPKSGLFKQIDSITTKMNDTTVKWLNF